MTTAIHEAHAAFCTATGQQLRLGIGEYSREIAWARFLSAGFTAADVLLVVTHLQRKIREGERRIGALRFSNLIEPLERFEEELSLAKAEQRNAKPAPTPRERVIQVFRPAVASENTQSTARPVGDYIAALREAAR